MLDVKSQTASLPFYFSMFLSTLPTLLQHFTLPPSPPPPPITCVHPASCICCVPGLPACICCYFSVGGFLIFFFFLLPIWFCIMSLSPVSRQWFYPMVGDIMLFYHRVEPRTGCWELSASRLSVSPYSLSHKHQRGAQGPGGALGCGAAAGGGAASGPSLPLTRILPLFVSSTICN